jgi:hypothetical protein
MNQILVHVLLEYKEMRKEREVADAHRPVEGVEEEEEEPDPAIGVVGSVGEEEVVTSGGGLEVVKEQWRDAGGDSRRWQCHPWDRTRVRTVGWWQ